ncbi:transcription factor S, partial [Candidatus Woesearchaeota archaeon]|nr:transcription factor S [Candidatus Woesearchaeota archaeon]
VEQDFETDPVTKAECPKCHNKEAYYWEVQTRAADEPPTKFLKCTKCKHIWRDYS